MMPSPSMLTSPPQPPARPERATGFASRLGARLEVRRTRWVVYACVALGLFALTWATQIAKSAKTGETIDFAVSDGEGYYLYLPCVLINGNLDFLPSLLEHSKQHRVDL